MRVYIVEDNATIRDTLRVTLEDLESGSGLGILETCRYRNPQQKVVGLSNHANPEIRWRCAQLGADAVFGKRTEIDDLLRYCAVVADKLEPTGHQLYPV